MTINYYTSEAATEPALLDTDSSSVYTYIRKDVTKKTRKDPTTEEETTYYKYQEAKLTKDQYQTYLVEQSASSNNTDVQTAIAELASQQESDKTDLQVAIAELAAQITGTPTTTSKS